jgi:hypothetical protein
MYFKKNGRIQSSLYLRGMLLQDTDDQILNYHENPTLALASKGW